MCSRTHAISGFTELCFPCMHVIESLRPRRGSVRRDGTDSIFACRDAGGFEMTSDWGTAHTLHLLDADPSLRALAGLGPGAQALRLAPARHTMV